MKTKKKEYSNIYTKMIVHHNEETVPFLKGLGCGSIKVKERRFHVDLERLESGAENVWGEQDYLYEYILMNKFIIQFLDKTAYDNCLELLDSDEDNVKIGAYALYELIETKKKEIQDKLK